MYLNLQRWYLGVLYETQLEEEIHFQHEAYPLKYKILPQDDLEFHWQQEAKSNGAVLALSLYAYLFQISILEAGWVSIRLLGRNRIFDKQFCIHSGKTLISR